jgi:hypothetical protein
MQTANAGKVGLQTLISNTDVPATQLLQSTPISTRPFFVSSSMTQSRGDRRF